MTGREIMEAQRAKDLAHHTLNIAWLTEDKPMWADGTPVERGDVYRLLSVNREYLRQATEYGMSTNACHCDPPCKLPA